VLHHFARRLFGFAATTSGKKCARITATIRATRYALCYMSIYRKIKRAPPDDLNYFERQRTAANDSTRGDDSDWLPRRKARPYDRLLVTTAAWRTLLPPTLQPHALCARFPRIANGLAAGWGDRDATMRYFDDLLTDMRGGRKGFPAIVLEELHSLKAFYEALHSPQQEGWRRG
jgi:hypothetical protein